MSEKLQPNYYAIIPATVRYDTDLNPNSKLLYGEITALCNQQGYCWASNGYFAKLYGVAPETISRWIRRLENKGYIRTTLDRSKGNTRYITIDNNINTYRQKGQEVLTKRSRGIDEKVKRVNPPDIVDNSDTRSKKLSNNTSNITDNNTNNIYIYDDEKEKELEELKEIFQAWIAADIIKHKRLTRAMETKIKSALKDYTAEEIKQAIKNYGYIVNDDRYFFNYKWSLDQFCTITQKDRIGSFLDLEVAKNNYRKDDSNGGYKQDRHTNRTGENTQEYSSDSFMREAIRRTEESGINPDELDIDF